MNQDWFESANVFLSGNNWLCVILIDKILFFFVGVGKWFWIPFISTQVAWYKHF